MENNEIYLQNKKIFGGTYFLLLVIFFTIFTAIDGLSGFITFSIQTSRENIVVTTLTWLLLVIVRFVPNVLITIGLWLMHFKSISKGLISQSGKWLIKIGLIINLVFMIFTLVYGSYVLINSYYSYNSTTIYGLDSYSSLIVSLVYLYFWVIFKFVTQLFMLIMVSSIKYNTKTIALRKTTSILAIVFGSLIIVNFVSVIKFTNAIVKCFEYGFTSFTRTFEYIYTNVFTVGCAGVLMILIGIFCLVNFKKKD